MIEPKCIPQWVKVDNVIVQLLSIIVWEANARRYNPKLRGYRRVTDVNAYAPDARTIRHKMAI